MQFWWQGQKNWSYRMWDQLWPQLDQTSHNRVSRCLGAQERAQWVKCLLQQQTGVSSEAHHHRKIWHLWFPLPLPLMKGEAEAEEYWIFFQVWVPSKCSGEQETLFQTSCWTTTEKSLVPTCVLRYLCTLIHTKECTDMYSHPHKPSRKFF